MGSWLPNIKVTDGQTGWWWKNKLHIGQFNLGANNTKNYIALKT